MDLISTHVPPCTSISTSSQSCRALNTGITLVKAAVSRSVFRLDHPLLFFCVRLHVEQLVLVRTWSVSVRELFKLITLILFSRELGL